MKTNNEKHLGFVLKYYRQRALDTRAAMRNVMRRTGIVGRPTRKWLYAAAAVLILLVVGSSLVWRSHAFGMVELAADSAIRTVTLPDSTQVTLREGASLAYKRNNPRAVTLRGTAYFQVRHDSRHPFTVSNTIATVRVLGTKFMVESQLMAHTSVYVTEGKVLFATAESTKGLILTKGMKALLSNGDRALHMVAAGSVNQTAWATGVFHFADTPLGDVLKDLSACYNVPLSADELDKRLTGDIQADSLSSVIQLIEQTLGVEIKRR